MGDVTAPRFPPLEARNAVLVNREPGRGRQPALQREGVVAQVLHDQNGVPVVPELDEPAGSVEERLMRPLNDDLVVNLTVE